MTIARVEPLTTARALRGPFDYRVPPRLSDEVDVGSILRVPFGPRRILGVVVEVAGASELPPERLSEPIEALESGAPPELVRLGLWVAREYCSTPSRGLALVLPPGTGAAGQRVKSRTELRVEITPEGAEALAAGGRLGSRQRLVLEALGDGELGMGELATSGGDLATVRRLERRGLVATRSTRVRRGPAASGITASTARPQLNADQDTAVARIAAALNGSEDAPRSQLLHGVTGSGKTEVYLAACEQALSQGRGAIVLVPEIGLTPQTVARFRARLGDRIALLHSDLTPGERYDEWRRLRDGEASVCVGPRSAVFAPVQNLGLIVIDEEHDSAYKGEGDPAYDARNVARERAERCGAVLVCGTATPRPESWVSLSRTELPRRADGGGMPAVRIVDMREADRRGGPVHPITLSALDRVASEGKRAIILINRRGFAPWLTCRSCGHHYGCPNCDVSLITHRHNGTLVCHHCAHSEPLPSSCGECGSVTLSRAGAGTEQIESLLAERLAPLPVLRLDTDTAATRGAHGRILAAFADAPRGAVLVGTQMVGKGHDFPDVTLSAILDADATLRFPDFRAEERTFAMVTQLAGRSGRGNAGDVVVQTLAPSAPSIAHAARHDAEGFLAGEIERRRELGYPPFSHLIRVNLSSEDAVRLDEAGGTLGRRLRESAPPETDILGPAPMFRVRGRHRRRVLIKTGRRADAVAAVGDVVERLASERALKDVAVGVDVDPQ